MTSKLSRVSLSPTATGSTADECVIVWPCQYTPDMSRSFALEEPGRQCCSSNPRGNDGKCSELVLEITMETLEHIQWSSPVSRRPSFKVKVLTSV